MPVNILYMAVRQPRDTVVIAVSVLSIDFSSGKWRTAFCAQMLKNIENVN